MNLDPLQPLVSVGIPTYNGAKTINKAIESVLAQDYSSIELVISDNASTDETQKICRGFERKDSRIKYIRQSENIGATLNFDCVLRATEGEYFMWLGDDDWLNEYYIKKCLEVLVQNHEFGLVAGKCLYYFEGGMIQQGERMFLQENDSVQRICSYYETVQNNGVFYGVYRKSILEKVRIYSVFAGDWLLVDHICRLGKVKTVDDAVINRKFKEKKTHEYLSGVERVSAFEKILPYFAFSLRVLWDILAKKTFLKEKNWVSRSNCSLKVLFVLNCRFAKYDFLNLIRIIKEYVRIYSLNISLWPHWFVFLLKHIPSLLTVSLNRRIRGSNLESLAMFSPIPPVKSGISDYSEDLLKELGKKYNVDVFVDSHYGDTKIKRKGYQVYSYYFFKWLNKLKNYKNVIFQVGNSSYHNYMYREIKRTGGVVVLHDGMNFTCRGDRTRLLEGTSVLVHDKSSFEKVFGSDVCCNLGEIPQLMPQPLDWEQLQTEKKRLRELRGITDEVLVIGAFGLISPAKNVYAALSAVDDLYNQDDDFLFIVAGHEVLDSRVIEFFESHKEDNRFLLETSLSIEALYENIIISDLCFNLRKPFLGETSSALLRIMSCGVPSIVTNIGSFSNFPDNCVIKTSSGIQVEEYKAILSKAKEDKRWLKDLGENSFKYIKKNHDPVIICKKYIERINHV